MREPAEVCPHIMVMTACSRRSQWARERRRAKGIVKPRFSQFQCAHLCDVYIGVVFPFFVDLVFVLSARPLDTSCTGFDFTFGSRKQSSCTELAKVSFLVPNELEDDAEPGQRREGMGRTCYQFLGS